mgnify:CR=1 FL=1
MTKTMEKFNHTIGSTRGPDPAFVSDFECPINEVRRVFPPYPKMAQKIAPNLHFSKQVRHLMHFSLLIRAGSFFFHSMASAGQAR